MYQSPIYSHAHPPNTHQQSNRKIERQKDIDESFSEVKKVVYTDVIHLTSYSPEPFTQTYHARIPSTSVIHT